MPFHYGSIIIVQNVQLGVFSNATPVALFLGNNTTPSSSLEYFYELVDDLDPYKKGSEGKLEYGQYVSLDSMQIYYLRIRYSAYQKSEAKNKIYVVLKENLRDIYSTVPIPELIKVEANLKEAKTRVDHEAKFSSKYMDKFENLTSSIPYSVSVNSSENPLRRHLEVYSIIMLPKIGKINKLLDINDESTLFADLDYIPTRFQKILSA